MWGFSNIASMSSETKALFRELLYIAKHKTIITAIYINTVFCSFCIFSVNYLDCDWNNKYN